MRVWRNWQTHQILAASRQCIYSLQALGRLISRAKIEYASMAELADAPDFGCVTTVHLFPASSRQVNFKSKIEYAGVAELADARDLGSRAARCAGSIPVTRTNEIPRNSEGFFIC